jgi:hypothetical protein
MPRISPKNITAKISRTGRTYCVGMYNTKHTPHKLMEEHTAKGKVAFVKLIKQLVKKIEKRR